MSEPGPGPLTRVLAHGDPPAVPMIRRRRHSLAFLAAVVAVFLVLRLPMSVVAAGVLPMVMLLRNGIRPPSRSAGLMWVFMLTALITSTYAWLTGTDVPVVNNATVLGVMMVLVAALTCSTSTRDALRHLVNGIQAGLWICLLIAIFEVVSGIKVLPLIYPDANTASAVAGNRFIVASFFPNYNDFSVAMALFGMILVAQLLIGTRTAALVKIARITALGAVCFFIVVIGSRGALIGLFLGSLLVALTAARLTRRRVLSVPTMLMLVVGAGAAGAFLMATPFVQESSTKQRGEILGNIAELLREEPARLWTGWSNMTIFQEAAAERFPGKLMDPHNLIVEIVVMYGLPALVAYGALWCYLAYRGLWQLRISAGWREVSAVVISVLLPVIGVVPSSTLRYYWLFLFGAAAVAALQIQQRRREQVLWATTGPVADHATAAAAS